MTNCTTHPRNCSLLFFQFSLSFLDTEWTCQIGESTMLRTSSLSQWNTATLESRSGRIRLLYRDDSAREECWETLEDLREHTRDSEGQFISLDLTEPMLEPLPEILYTALKNARWDATLQFSLPVILQHNPHVASPFINRAILWQRLCDLLLVDDVPYRETVLVLENVDQASPTTQHEIARLIRFHELHSIHRSFVMTLDRCSYCQIIPELQNITSRNI